MDIFLLVPATGQWDKFIAETAAGVGATKSAWLKQNEQLLKNSYETTFPAHSEKWKLCYPNVRWRRINEAICLRDKNFSPLILLEKL